MDKLQTDMTTNMQSLLERDQKLDDMLLKTQDMGSLSNSMASKSRKVKNKLWWQGKALYIVGASVVVVIILETNLLGDYSYYTCNFVRSWNIWLDFLII